MDTDLPALPAIFTGYRKERRQQRRICDPFPAKVKGVNVDGVAFEVDTVIDNISSACLYLRLMSFIERGARVRVTFRLSGSVKKAESSPMAEVTGEVLRADTKPGGVCGVAIGYKLHRFHFAKE